MKRNKQLITIVILGVLVALLSACTGEEPIDLTLAGTYAAQTLAAMPSDSETAEPSPTEAPTGTATEVPTPTPLPIVDPVGPVNFPENVNPLTGLPVADPTILDRRPVFVKVANYPISGRPHAGLSTADMVFEYYIGFGGNRFIALFYGQDADKIGPVRSGRMIDPYLVSLYEGVLGMVSADARVFEHIRNILDNRVISDKTLCPGICDDGRGIVISVFADSEALTEITTRRGVVNQRYVLEGMAFDPAAPDGGQEANQVNIRFSPVNPDEWRYDQESGYYLRWIDNAEGQRIDLIPLVDQVNNQQLAFSNVVVLLADHDEIAPTLHDITMWDNFGGQRAVVFRDGQAYDLNWKTPSKTQPIQFIDSDGEVFRLKPGRTWVVIMGLNSGVTSVDGTWTFDFFMP
jgi:hypothetical protein